MRDCGDDVRELLHDGHPTVCVADTAFAYVNAFRAHVNVGFFCGAEIADPDRLLEGTGKFMRHVKLRPEHDVDAKALGKLIETAYRDIKRRQRGDPKLVERPPLWTCPRCGARLVTRNLWHSCGRFRIEDLFVHARPEVLDLARRYVDLLRSLGDVQVIPQKTRLVCVARVRFAGLYPRKNGFRAGFALRRWLRGPRIVKTADYGPRWRGHFIDISSAGDLDDELAVWLRESHDTVGIQSDMPLRRRPAASLRRGR